MANGKHMAAVVIGVQAAEGLPYLAAAVNGARAFRDWADALAYRTTLVTDEEQPVTVGRLRGELELVLSNPRPIHRMVLYFAGHGLIREAEEGLWLLSDWRRDQRAVAVEALKRRLYKFGIEQIAIFADACRSLPADVDIADLTADGVLGLGSQRPASAPPIDKFIAAQDGAKAYAVPGPTPDLDRCLFSGVLLEGLWGTNASAFSKIEGLKDKVTSSSLGEYLRMEVPKRAHRYGCTLNPNVSPTFPEGDNIYFGEGSPPTPPNFPAWPPPAAITGAAQGPEAKVSVEGVLGNRAILDAVPQANLVEAEPVSASLLDQLRQQPRPTHFETGSGFAVSGRQVKAVWTTEDIVAEQDIFPTWWRLRQRSSPSLQRPVPLLIEFADGLFAAATALPNFIATMMRESRGVAALIYRQIGSPEAITATTELAIAAMESGALRTETATDLAVQLRQNKHADPVLGAISAYLYDAIGDIDSIRRMAFFYIQMNQPIPYDIALLGQLKGEWRNGAIYAQVPQVPAREPRTEAEKPFAWTFVETPEGKGVVGGLWPWLRQGWAFLDYPAPDGSTMVLPGVIELARHLSPGRFATLDAEGGSALAELFGLAPRGATVSPASPLLGSA